MLHIVFSFQVRALHIAEAMANKMTTEFDKMFTGILAKAGSTAANEVLQEAMKCLTRYKLSYELNFVNCKFFLTHKTNRGGLMLSPHNCHRNAAKIDSGGADRKQLTNAVAVELSPSGWTRESQLAANQKLIGRAGGLLAEINGEERYLTLGCGHTTAFCKLAEAGGKTPIKSIACPDGGIDTQKIKKNSEFKSMLEEGWSWTIVCHEVDTAYPQFARVAQQALNVANHVSTEVGELETAVTLADTADELGLADITNWKELALANVRALNVPCSSYAHIILDFVIMYGGGQGAPQIKFMDDFAKQFQANICLGETFWNTVTSIVFPTKAKPNTETHEQLLNCTNMN